MAPSTNKPVPGGNLDDEFQEALARDYVAQLVAEREADLKKIELLAADQAAGLVSAYELTLFCREIEKKWRGYDLD